ncbi:MAG: M20/M25/M40 family metallo-hydrolase [Patescibacteria group bacterium]|nr:M20/M25/M40 family metallo-hydrolase [Patescibacteria group bacterium]
MEINNFIKKIKKKLRSEGKETSLFWFLRIARFFKKVETKINSEFDYQLNFIQKVIKATGPRLAGSTEEKRGAQIIAEEFSKVVGRPAAIETFRCYPKSSMAAIPILSYFMLFLLIPLYIFLPLAGLIVMIWLLLFFFVQIIHYWGFFDFLFAAKKSQNVYSIIEPLSNKKDFTLILGSHIDSAWSWGRLFHGSKYIIFRVLTIIISIIGFLFFSVFRVGFIDIREVVFSWTTLISVLFIPGFYYASQIINLNKGGASPGAGDNLSGVSVGLWLIKYYQTHPEKYPKNCRIVLAAFGAEELGLKGSKDFVQKHKNDLLEGSVWLLNIDGPGLSKNFYIAEQEVALGVKHNSDFCRLAHQSLEELGIKSQFYKIPVGGTDAAPFSQAGIRAITLTNQGVDLSGQYHTALDDIDRLNLGVVKKMNEVCVKLIKKIDEFVHQA